MTRLIFRLSWALRIRGRFPHFQCGVLRRLSKYDCLLLFAVALYSLFFSAITTLRMYALETYAYDLGIYNQAMYTALTGKGFFSYTPDLIAVPTGSIFGVHFSPLLILLLPLYAIRPSPATLLVLQSVFLALGAIPLYFIAKSKLRSEKLGLFFAVLYLMNPALQGVNWYDFHPEAFIILPFLVALYSFDLRRWGAYFLSFGLLLSTIEAAAVLGAAMGVYGLLRIRDRKLEPDNRRWVLRVSAITIFGSLLWFLLSTSVILHFNPNNLYLGNGSSEWQVLGARSLVNVPIQVLTRPTSALSAIAYDLPSKELYVVLLLAPLLFLPFLSPRTVAMIFPWLAIALLSNYPPYYELATQYPAYLLAPIFYGSVLGLGKLEAPLRHHLTPRFFKSVATGLGVSCLIFVLLSSPLVPWALGRYPQLYYGAPGINDHTQLVNYLVGIIPPDASVMVSNNIFPLVSSRQYAYTPPTSVAFPRGTSFRSQLESTVSNVEYILLDFVTSTIDTSIVLSDSLVKADFGLLAYGDGAFLLKRGVSGNGVMLKPFQKLFSPDSLGHVQYDSIINDPRATNHHALMFSGPGGIDFWYGPYLFLPPGDYVVSFDLGTDGPVSGEILTLPVLLWPSPVIAKVEGDNSSWYHLIFSIGEPDSKLTLVTRTILGQEFSGQRQYQRFQVFFNATTLGVYEFPGLNVKTNEHLYLDQVAIDQVASSSEFDSGLVFQK